MNVGLDIDGVIRNFDIAVNEVYKRLYPDLPDPGLATDWNLHEHYPIGRKIYDIVWKDYVRECLGEAPMYDGAFDFVKKLSLEHDITIVTSQPTYMAMFWTIRWLEDNAILPYISNLVILMKGMNKGDISVDVLIDDYVKNLESARKNGIMDICFDRPWNHGKWEGRIVRNYEQVFEKLNELEVAR